MGCGCLFLILVYLLCSCLVYNVVWTLQNQNFQQKEPLPLTDNLTCAIVVHTFDGYQRFWTGFIHFYTKYASQVTWTVYFATEIKCPDNLPAHFVHLPCGQGEWGKRLRVALSQIPEQYVLYMQEDMWLTNTLTATYLNQAFQLAYLNNWNLFKLQVDCQHKINPDHHADYNNPQWYIASHQPGIWNKSFLLSTLSDNMTPFRHETSLNHRLHMNKDLANTCECHQHFFSLDFPYLDVSRRGRLLDSGRNMLKKEGLSFHVQKDEVMTRRNY